MPDFQLAKLQQLLRGLDRQVDAAGEAFRGQLTRGASDARRKLNTLIDARTGDKGQLLRRPSFTATGTARALDAFLAINARAIASFAQMSDRAATILQVTGTGGQRNADRVRAVARLLEQDLADKLDRVIQDVYGIAQRGQAMAQSAAEVLAEMDEALNTYLTYSRSTYDTALMSFTQALVTTDTSPTSAYVYLGPIDERIRPFCLKLVGTVWTKDRIDTMDNGITPNTFLRRGGPNCRHLWVPAPASMAQFINTGQRVDPSLVEDAAFAARATGIRRTA